ncbi:hypothetical protein OCU_28280 [Mycobacterium intracellulare ATCC 13950]|uniref:Uncharacterized protein n=1 Tax=Mycobacterium intracellulare (strain ATCC 13950 / DSM 43223 / JCM 6384 / NCTC 13025 / 3600) TaxID=487521 RepID=H8INU9_MYCIA|nr:hypothetical protein OCU_28280 [Mycobacterium intracellulare ATCC 13950]
MVGRGAHPIGQLQKIVLAYAQGKGVRQLSQFDGVVAQVLAEARLNSGHDFSLGLGQRAWSALTNRSENLRSPRPNPPERRRVLTGV